MDAADFTSRNATPGRTGRLAYFVNLYPAVSHTFIRREIEALESLGWEVCRFSLRKENGLVDERDATEARRTRPLLPLPIGELLLATAMQLLHPIRLMRAVRMSVRMARRSERGFLRSIIALPEAIVLCRWMNRERIVHAHAHFGTNSTTVLRIVRSLGGPTYSFTNHGTAELDNAAGWSLAEKVADAAFVVAASWYVRAQLCRFVPLSLWERIHVIRCGLHLLPDSQPSPVPDTPQLLCIGRLSEEKGHLVLLRALARLARSVRCSLIIAGDGPLRSRLQAEIDLLGLRGVVTLHGSATGQQIAELLRTSRGLVLPSLAEGLPVVLMESFQAGRPVIASNVGGIAELVEPGVSGWLVPPGDEVRLTNAVRELLSASPEALSRYGRAGFEAVQRLHDASLEAARLSRLFESAGQVDMDAVVAETASEPVASSEKPSCVA